MKRRLSGCMEDLPVPKLPNLGILPTSDTFLSLENSEMAPLGSLTTQTALNPPIRTKKNDNFAKLRSSFNFSKPPNGFTKLTLIRCDSDMTQISEAAVASSMDIRVTEATPRTRIKFAEQIPKTILLIKQWKSDLLTQTLVEVANWLKEEFSARVLIEAAAKSEELMHLDVFSEADDIDFCLVLGGDGTLLHLNSLFQEKRSVPPVLPLAQGSLGFMTPYSCVDYKDHIRAVMAPKPIDVTIRARLYCEYYKMGNDSPVSSYQVLNELLVYRGLSPYLTKLEFFVDDELVTCIQADGVVISTPSGSTAYSLSAGGSLMPPDVPAILVTPACPHSLSFRPLVLPDSCVLKLQISSDARSSALATFDGRNPTTMDVGDCIVVRTSPWPMPTISLVSPMVEWFRSITTRLNWNVRELQKGHPEKGKPAATSFGTCAVNSCQDTEDTKS